MYLDAYDDIAEAWGPFVSPGQDFDGVASELWEEASGCVQVKEYHFFVNEANRSALEFVEKIGAERRSRHLDMSASPDLGFAHERASCCRGDDAQSEISRLHDQAFPGGWMSGAEIAERCGSEDCVITRRNERAELEGYLYFSRDSRAKSLKVEFVAVREQSRNQGVAIDMMALLAERARVAALRRIEVTVSDQNAEALALYSKLGFLEDRACIHWVLPRSKASIAVGEN